MPVSDTTVTSFTDLGVVGAALLIVLIVVILIFALQNSSINKLCTKIDQLVTLHTTYLATSEKDNKMMLRMLTNIDKKVTRIDDRTFFIAGSKFNENDKEVES